MLFTSNILLHQKDIALQTIFGFTSRIYHQFYYDKDVSFRQATEWLCMLKKIEMGEQFMGIYTHYTFYKGR